MLIVTNYSPEKKTQKSFTAGNSKRIRISAFNKFNQAIIQGSVNSKILNDNF